MRRSAAGQRRYRDSSSKARQFSKEPKPPHEPHPATWAARWDQSVLERRLRLTRDGGGKHRWVERVGADAALRRLASQYLGSETRSAQTLVTAPPSTSTSWASSQKRVRNLAWLRLAPRQHLKHCPVDSRRLRARQHRPAVLEAQQDALRLDVRTRAASEPVQRQTPPRHQHTSTSWCRPCPAEGAAPPVIGPSWCQPEPR